MNKAPLFALTGVAGLVLALSVVLSCGQQEDSYEKCEDTCKRMDDCGFLPFALGRDRANCRHRCLASDSLARGGFFACFEDVIAPDANNYCVGGSCLKSARCLASLSGTPAILPSRTVSIRLQLPAASAAKEEDAASIYESPPPECSVKKEQESKGAPPELCDGLGLTSIDVFLTPSLGSPQALSLGCAQALRDPSEFRGVTVGEVLIGAKLRSLRKEIVGAADAGTGGGGSGGAQAEETEQNECRVYYAPPFVLLPGQEGVEYRRITIPMQFDPSSPLPNNCEDSALKCSDGQDNDRDGRIDCADPLCARFCVNNSCDGGCPDAAAP